MKHSLISLVSFAISICANCQPKPQQASFVMSPDGIRLAYDVRGKGATALVFVHGWSCDRTYWKDQMEPLSKKFQVVSIDLAGHGESGLERKAWTMEAFGQDVAAVVKKLDLKRVVLVGHSMGAPVIAEAAFHLRDRIAGLIMVDQYTNLGAGMTPESVEAFAAQLRPNFSENTNKFVRSMFHPKSDKELVDRVAADMASAPPAIALPMLEDVLSYSRKIAKSLQTLNLPTVAINTNAQPIDMASMKQYGVDVVIMEGVGHFIMMEDPARFNSVLETTVNKLTR